MKRFLAALLAFPIMLIGISAIGLMFVSVGEAISLVARGGGSSWPGWVRIVMAGLVGLVAGVGIARLLQLTLTAGQQLSYRFPRILQAFADSVAAVLMFALLVGMSFLVLAVFTRHPSQRMPFGISGFLLSVGAAFVLLSRFRKSRTPQPPPPPAAAARKARRVVG
jgi:hypothetical protein